MSKKHKSYHFQMGRCFLGFKELVYNLATRNNCAVMSFDKSGIFLVDYYVTLFGDEEDMDKFYSTLVRIFGTWEFVDEF